MLVPDLSCAAFIFLSYTFLRIFSGGRLCCYGNKKDIASDQPLPFWKSEFPIRYLGVYRKVKNTGKVWMWLASCVSTPSKSAILYTAKHYQPVLAVQG